ncbi:MAG: hypothetical protein JST67_09440 [Bacteroidetes bacterium]|nr:hypothetical protein [Bacteroidota bacterium]
MKFIKPIFFCLTMIFVLTSCASSEKDFEIGYVKTIQDGCGEYYTYETDSISKDAKYVFVSDFSGNAFVNINGNDVSFKRDTTDKNQNKEIWLSNSFTIEINTHIVEQYDEGSYDIGTMVIKFADKTKNLKIHGTTGC